MRHRDFLSLGKLHFVVGYLFGQKSLAFHNAEG